MCPTIELIEQTFNARAGMLGCFRLLCSHTHDKVGKKLNAVQLDFGISERQVVATATNNGSNFIEIFKEFGVKDTNVNTNHVKS